MRSRGINRHFWKNRRVFLTGHTGFMGGWLALWLARLGAKVSGYALPPPTDPCFFDAAGLARDVHSTMGDVRDLAALRQALATARPEVVLHLAAQPLVRRAYGDPVETYATNVMGTVHLLEAMRGCGSVQAAVVVTSDKVYDNRERTAGYREDDRLGGREPYGSSKACAEMVTRAYRESYFSNGANVGIATARAGNVIGGGDFAQDRIVPDAVRAFAAGEPLVVRNPAATRPWQHVLEPLAGYLMLAENLAEAPGDWSAGWNFGPEESDSKPVSWLAEELCRLWGDAAAWIPANAEAPEPYEAKLLAVDIEKAKRELGWRPAWDVGHAADATVVWYKDFVAGADTRKRTLDQIEEFAA